MQNIGFSNSGYIMKPLQPRSAIYRAPNFTGHRVTSQYCFHY